jgi:hypothetical protein
VPCYGLSCDPPPALPTFVLPGPRRAGRASCTPRRVKSEKIDTTLGAYDLPILPQVQVQIKIVILDPLLEEEEIRRAAPTGRASGSDS